MQLVRKQFFISPSQIKKLDRIARDEGTSVAEIVRAAIDTYDPNDAAFTDFDTPGLMELVSTRLKEAINSTQKANRNIDRALNKLSKRSKQSMSLSSEKRQTIDAIFKNKGYSDYQWIDPQKIIVAQWVRLKCQFGCGEYGRGACCPPNTPPVAECERFFGEYNEAIILHFEGLMDKPEDRHAWSRKINAELVKLEREIFLAGCERAFLLFMDSCCFCKECTGDRQTCNEPRMARPAPEAMAVDVYSTVRQFGFPIDVRTNYDQKMDRYAFLMVH